MAPALLTRMSGMPVAASNAPTDSLRDRSSACAFTSTEYCLRMLSAALSTLAALRATICTEHPSAANPRAIARPIPLEAPVTTALCPFNARSTKSPGRVKSTCYLFRQVTGCAEPRYVALHGEDAGTHLPGRKSSRFHKLPQNTSSFITA